MEDFPGYYVFPDSETVLQEHIFIVINDSLRMEIERSLSLLNTKR